MPARKLKNKFSKYGMIDNPDSTLSWQLNMDTTVR